MAGCLNRQGKAMHINKRQCDLPPRHPALASYDLDMFPWQGYEQWKCEHESVLIDTISISFHVRALNISAESDLKFRAFASHTYMLAGLGIDVGVERGNKNFYLKSWDLIDKNGHSCGFLATGGNNDTIQIYINGDGCAVIRDWREFHKRCKELDVRITRIDLAHDDYKGKHNIKTAVAMFKAGKFASGGRMPKCSQAGNWIMEDGLGKTFYVGSRKSGKLLRVYDKGKEQGDPKSNWVRWEVELKRDKIDIPLEAIIFPTRYFTGSYRNAFDWINGERTYMQTIAKKAKIRLDAAIGNAKNQYGKLINALSELGYSSEQIVRKLVREGIPYRLMMPDVAPPVSNTGGKYDLPPF